MMPVLRGEVQSSFAMTEPEGAGSDPGMTKTYAERASNNSWRIHGRKWFITGAGESKHFIVMARTSDDPRKGLTAFLFHADQPGWKIERRIPIMGPEEHGGHCEITFDGLEVSDDNILMGVGDGLKMTQIRLGPARLTHCMRWTGMGRRALEIAMARIEQRHAFGQKLAEKESVQMMVGEAAMQLDISRLVTMRAAWKLDQGDFARKEVSTAKIIAADALHRAADTALQLLGARGYSKDTPVEWMYRYARQARLVDGASEVHRMVIANFLRREGSEYFGWRTHG
jgi:acyl-CoA dehydrogenase